MMAAGSQKSYADKKRFSKEDAVWVYMKRSTDVDHNPINPTELK